MCAHSSAGDIFQFRSDINCSNDTLRPPTFLLLFRKLSSRTPPRNPALAILCFHWCVQLLSEQPVLFSLHRYQIFIFERPRTNCSLSVSLKKGQKTKEKKNSEQMICFCNFFVNSQANDLFSFLFQSLIKQTVFGRCVEHRLLHNLYFLFFFFLF